MKPSTAVFASLFLLIPLASAGEKPVVIPHPVTLAFYITGMECAACTDSVNQAVSQVKSVTEVQPEELGVLNISFESHVSSAREIAQAVAEAFPLHGKPCEATLKRSVDSLAGNPEQ